MPPKKNMTLGEKLAFNMEMQFIKDALAGNIPSELQKNKKFMETIEKMRADGLVIEAVSRKR